MTRAGDLAIRWATTISVVVLAGIAAVLSYKHMRTLVLEYGETSWTAALLPVSVDGMIVASSMTLLADSRNGQRSGLLPWTLLVIGSPLCQTQRRHGDELVFCDTSRARQGSF